MRKYSSNLEIARFVHDFLKQNKGWRFKRGKKHNKLYSPSNKVFPIPSTPSCKRAFENFKHDLMQAKNDE